MKNEDSSVGGPALMIGIGSPKGPEGMDEGSAAEICIPMEKLKISQEGQEDVEPSVGDIVNPDMKITRVEGGNAYMVAVDGMKDQAEPTLEDEESDLRKQAEEQDKMGMA